MTAPCVGTMFERSTIIARLCRCTACRTLLHAAASNGNAELVKFLLEKGSSPNTSDDEVIHTAIALCGLVLEKGTSLADDQHTVMSVDTWHTGSGCFMLTPSHVPFRMND